MAEVIALMEEFGTSVLQPGAVVGIAVTVILFILEVRWSHAPTSHYHATYAYEVSGKQYQYKYLERAVPPVQIQLYYLDDPGRAFRSKEKRSGFAQVFFLLFPIAVGVAVMLLLGIR